MRSKKLIVSLVLIASFIFSFIPVEVFANTSLDTPTNVQFYPRATWIGLNWDAVNGAAGYDVEVDGTIYDSKWPYFYIGSFQTGVTNTFTVRVRAKNADATILSPWSDPVEVHNLDSLLAPTNVKYTATDTSITFTWDPIQGADYYHVELDGVVQDIWIHCDDRTYTIKDLDPNKKHTYSFRVRGLEETPYYGSWSEAITASTTGPVERWETVANLPTTRRYLAATTVNGKIYVTGGDTWADAIPLKTVEEYDPETNKWIKKADMIIGRRFHGAAEVNGKIYAIGGSARLADDYGKIEEYDLDTNKWISKAPMPIKSSRLGVTALNGKIYAIGGAPYLSTEKNAVQEYNPITNTWTRKADMPTERYHLGVVTANGKIYAIGGQSGTTASSTVEEYDPSTDTWTRKADMPNARSSMSVAVVDGIIYVIGSTMYGSYDTVDVYNPTTDKWSTGTKLPYPVYAAGTAVLNNEIYVIGGHPPSGNQTKNSVIKLITNPDKYK